jgi:type II secretory pathway pseudopilin PulG
MMVHSLRRCSLLTVCVALLAVPAPRVHAAQKSALQGIEYVPAEAVAAAVVNFKKLKTAPGLELMPWEILTAAGLQELGFDPLEIEQVIAVVAPPSMTPTGEVAPGLGAIVTLSSPVTLKPALLARAERVLVAGKQAYRFRINPPVELVVISGKTMVLGTPGFLESMLKASAGQVGSAARSPLRQLIGTQAPTDDVAVFLVVEPLRPMLNSGLQNTPPLPPALEFVRSLPDQLRSLRLNINVESENQVQLVATATDAEAATAIDQGVRGSLGMLKSMFLASTLTVPAGEGQVGVATRSYFTRLANTIEKRMLPKRDGVTVTLEAGIGGATSASSVGMLAALLLPAVQQAREAARRSASKNNMKQLMLAFHNYYDVYKHFPARANYDNNGKPLLSWRVHILPFIDQQALYRRFKLNEPWDSPHNKQLIRLMPITYANPNLPAGSVTNYLAVIGADSVVSATGVKMRQITDGTSNTAVLVEVDVNRAVPWSKPVDHEIEAKDPKAGLGSLRPGGFHMAMADGSVRFVRISVDPKYIQAVVTKSGREVVERP